jgi:hypothetical protein
MPGPGVVAERRRRGPSLVPLLAGSSSSTLPHPMPAILLLPLLWPVKGIEEAKGGEGQEAVSRRRELAVPGLVLCSAASSSLLLGVRSAPPLLFCCFSTFFAFLFSNPHLPLLVSGEVVDGNSGAPGTGNSGPLLFFFFLLLRLALMCLGLCCLHLELLYYF